MPKVVKTKIGFQYKTKAGKNVGGVKKTRSAAKAVGRKKK